MQVTPSFGSKFDIKTNSTNTRVYAALKNLNRIWLIWNLKNIYFLSHVVSIFIHLNFVSHL